MACGVLSAPLSVKIHTMNTIMTSAHQKLRALLAIFLIASVALFANSAAAVDVSGLKIAEMRRVGTQDLLLNGAGIRYAAAGLVRVYVAALYLPQKRSNGSEIAALAGPKRMNLHLLRDVSSNDFSKGLLSGMRANLSLADQQKHFDNLLRLGAIFGQTPQVKKGDLITLDLIPGTGMLSLINGKRVGETIADESFYYALLQIWLGPKPIEETLKPALLGTSPANDNALNNNRDRY